MDDETVIAGLNRVWDTLIDLGRQLDTAGWATPSLCPGWDVATVFRHLISIDQMMVGWLPDGAGNDRPFDQRDDYLTETAAWSGPQVLERFEEVIATRRRELAALPAGTSATPTMTPIGPGTYGRLLQLRLFDSWVHELDIRVPLGLLPVDPDGIGAQRAMEEIMASMAYIAGRKVGVPDQQSLRVEVTGPIPGAANVEVQGRAQVVETLASPTATLHTDSVTLTLLACGRIDPDVAISAGRIRWSGDATLGERAARQLAFTI